MIYEYVMSGTGMVRMSDYNQQTVDIVNQYLKDSPYNISLLFNALTEKGKAPGLNRKTRFTESFRIHADSGGLQITTLNLPINEVKQKHKEIYETQAKWSDIAMSFDEMAVRQMSSDEKSILTVASSRLFVNELGKQMAHNTAKNIKEQIAAFEKHETDSKIMLICQGNDRDSYKVYAETIWSDLTDYERSKIYGIAPSSASIGNGQLEIAEMLYSMGELELPDDVKKNIHLLGVGSAAQLGPILYSPDYFKFVEHLSFDSTSAARRYGLDGFTFNTYRLSKDSPEGVYKAEYKKIIDYYKKYFNMVDGFDPEDIDTFIESATYFSSKNTDKIWTYRNKDNEMDWTLSDLLLFFVTAKYVEEMMEIIESEEGRKKPIYKDIRSYDDFNRYKREFRLYYKLKSNGVSRVETEAEFKAKEIRQNIIQSL